MKGGKEMTGSYKAYQLYYNKKSNMYYGIDDIDQPPGTIFYINEKTSCADNAVFEINNYVPLGCVYVLL